MIVNTSQSTPPVRSEQSLVATLVDAAAKRVTTTVDTILDSVTASDFADQSLEHVFSAVKHLVGTNAPVDRAAIDAASKPPGIPVDIDGVFATPPITDDRQVKAAIAHVVRDAALRRTLIGLQDAASDAQHASTNQSVGLDGIACDLVRISECLSDAQIRATGISSMPTLGTEIDGVVAQLQKTHGKKFLGLPTGTLPTLDKFTLGVRGFNLLAAAPGVGKTSLGTQIGVDVVRKNKDAVFIFFSCEMSRRDIYHRLLSMMSELHWRTIVLGSPDTAKTFSGSGSGTGSGLVFDYTQMMAFHNAVADLKSIGNRVFILDSESTPEIRYESMLGAIRKAKKLAGIDKAFVLVDSLQSMPFVKPEGTPWSNDIERDNHVIGRMLALQRATGDALMLISEQNKEGMGKSALKSTRGTARGVYSPDCVFILQQPKEPTPDPDADEHPIDLKIIKGRDGTRRGTIPLEFHHVTCTFTEPTGVVSPNQLGGQGASI